MIRNRPILSIVAPAFNEEDGLAEFHRRVVAVLGRLDFPFEIVYVNDGSRDGSLQVMRQLQSIDDRVAVINLSRNFGKEIALTAGLDHARGEAAIVMDTDLQHPPELIPLMVDKWREGYDVVYATRRGRNDESWFKRKAANIFYRLLRRIGEVPMPRDAGDFRLLNSRCLNALAACRERRRFMKGLFAWIGFRQVSVVYDCSPRFAGITKWNHWRLWNLAVEGITSLTIAPLKIATFIGIDVALIAFAYGCYIVARTLWLGIELPGYASLMVAILFLGGMELVALGVIGEYVGRVFVETKGRPLYLVEDLYEARRYSAKSETQKESGTELTAAIRSADRPVVQSGHL